MKILGLDIETTGLEPGDHRIIEFVGKVYEWPSMTVVDQVNTLIDPQRSIPALIQGITNITPTDVMGQHPWDVIAPAIHALMLSADAFVIHNAKFDLGFLDYEFDRVGLVPVKRPTCDTSEARWATAEGKTPRLGELAFAMGVPYDGAAAHRGEYDVDIMMACFQRGVDWGWFELPAAPALQVAA